MKAFFTACLLIITAATVKAQNNFDWTVYSRSQPIAHFTQEDIVGNVVTLTSAQLPKKGSLQLVYASADTAWTRWIMITDSLGNNLVERIDATNCTNGDGLSFCISNKLLKKLLGEHNHLVKVYTVAVPTDPAKAATVRVRRVPVAVIRMK